MTPAICRTYGQCYPTRGLLADEFAFMKRLDLPADLSVRSQHGIP